MTRKPAKVAVPTESESQAAVVALAALCETKEPRLKNLFAIPNGAGWLHPKTQQRLKREGRKAGVPDLMLAVHEYASPIPAYACAGLFIEMKREGGGIVSKEQRDWHQRLIQQRFTVVVCEGATAAWGAICEYLDRNDLLSLLPGSSGAPYTVVEEEP